MKRAMILLTCLASACGPAAGTRNDSAASANQAVSVPETAGPANERAPVPAARPRLMLVANGIELAGGDRAQVIGFGAAEDQVVADLERALGRPDERSDNPECPPGPIRFAAWRDRLTVNFQEGRFVGWALERDAPEPRTPRGIGIGSTRAQLERAYPTEVREGSLGHEFSAEQLYGVLSGTEPDARVEALWAGVNCIFH